MAAPQRSPSNRRGSVQSSRPALSLASQLNARQQQERHQNDVADQSDQEPVSGVRSIEDFYGTPNERAFLEQPTRSYTQPEATAEEQEGERQRRMQQTARQFLSPGDERTEPQEPRTRHEERRPGRNAPEAESGGEEPEPLSTQERDRANRDRSRAIRFAAQQQQDAKEASPKAKKVVSTIQDGKRLFRRIRQVSLIASGWGILLLIVELNVRTAMTLLNIKIKGIAKATKPEMLATGCINAGGCVGCFLYAVIAAILFSLASGLLNKILTHAST